ncbi:hypothetical protein F2P56_031369 [Juglans regia]|uniref:Retrotransposon gag domain-containing protein n=1 Tax=Juglans regia TaxID=51240 RepID=A0A833TMJ1_JUGRE|nr:hypothetical protein F2P56_031369 [Juglans regia]
MGTTPLFLWLLTTSPQKTTPPGPELYAELFEPKINLVFINDTLLKPQDLTDPLHEAWERCNALVVSWLQNSISSSLKSSIALVDDARQIWVELKYRFTQQNGHRIFQLKKALTGLNQENDSVSIYFGKLKTLWDELHIYDPLPDCTCGKLTILLDRYQRDCVIQFLMGLNESFHATRNQIMLLDPLPPINKIFSMIQQQEMQNHMLHVLPSPDSMALAVRQPYIPSKTPFKPPNSYKRDRPFCTHCKIQGHNLENCFKAGNAQPPLCTYCHLTGHVADKCYKLHGYPRHKFHAKNNSPNFSSAHLTSVEPVASADEKLAFTKDQYQQLLSLLQSKEASIANHSVSTVQTDCSSPSLMNGTHFCLTSSTQAHNKAHQTPWIIETDATDHMVCNTSFLSAITSNVSFVVRLPNGYTAPVSHIGTVKLTNTLDLLSWTTIGMGEIKNGLYHLIFGIVE